MMLMTDPQPSGAFEWTQESWGRALRCAALPARHLFTTRDVELRDDEKEWEAVAASLGVTRDRLLLIRQVHGITVAIARRGQERPRVWPEADILITDAPDVAIGVRVADCAPVLLLDRRTGAAGAAHAGWRGAAAHAAAVAVRAMQQAFTSDPSDMVAAVGPCLGACCGEVGPDVLDAFRAGGADAASIDAWFRRGVGDRSFLDLSRANRDQLIAAGVPPDAIFDSGLCTRTHHARLHSYRADRERAGRLLGAIRATAAR
jgi:purine-nucleoside/S-methyl-5'-thioadenosine phosphorylase / adenosine deaminase